MDVVPPAPKLRETSAHALCFASARELAGQIRARRVSAREVMTAFLAQINRLNPHLNAIVAKLDDDSCLALADAADRALARGDAVGPLHGLPTAFKDLESAIGFRFTKGSPIYKDVIATEDTALVERIRHAGAIPIGKTNVPEFGMGSHTYNNVYGKTRNPYDLQQERGRIVRSGAGAALAGGNVAFRGWRRSRRIAEEPGQLQQHRRVAAERWPGAERAGADSVRRRLGEGADGAVGLGCRVPAEHCGRRRCARPDVFSIASRMNLPARSSVPFRARAWRGVSDLGGLPLDRRVRAVLDAQRQTFASLGCIVEDACPDLANVDEIFVTLRTWASWNVYGPVLAEHRARMKPEAIWDIEKGKALSAEDLARALMLQGQLLERMRKFQERYEFLVCAVNQVPPFDAAEPWPRSIEGVPMENYISWMKTAYWISTTLPSGDLRARGLHG